MAIYPLRTMLGAAFHFAMGYLLVIALAVIFKGVALLNVPALLSLIPSFALLAAFGWSLAILFGLATVRFRDFKHLSEVGFQALFYLTPIMYPEEQMRSLLERRTVGWIFYLNPFVPILELLRSPVVAGHAAVAEHLPGRVAHHAADGRPSPPLAMRVEERQDHLQPVTPVRGFLPTWRESS